MAKYFSFLYDSAVLYGVSTVLQSIADDSGPSIGGNSFILSGLVFLNEVQDDDFTNGVLNPARWSSSLVGTGSYAVGAAHLQLSTGTTTGSSVEIESVNDFLDFQGEVRVDLPVIAIAPTADADMFEYRLAEDANNYVRMRLVVGTSKQITLVSEVYAGGVLINQHSQSWTAGTSTLKILRFKDKVYFIANGSIVYTSLWTQTTVVKVVLGANNLTSTYDATSIVEYFEFKPFAAFGDNPIHDTVVVSGARARGYVPPSTDARGKAAAYAGNISVYMVAVTTGVAVDAYEYYFEDALKIVNSTQSSIVLSMIGDDQIVTKPGVKKGLGL